MRLCLALMFVAAIAGCGSDPGAHEASHDGRVDSAAPASNEEADGGGAALAQGISLVGAYVAAFETYLAQDPELAAGVEFIAIDCSTLQSLSDQEKQEVLSHFAKPGLQVMDASMDTLIQRGLATPSSIPSGLLFWVASVQVLSPNSVAIEGSEFRGGTGAVGARCVAAHQNGVWAIASVDGWWVS